MARLIILFLVTNLLAGGFFKGFALNATDEPLVPLKQFSSGSLQLVENFSICQGGIGNQQTVFLISGSELSGQRSAFGNLPLYSPVFNLAFNMGCSLNSYYFSFSKIDDSSKFKEVTKVDEKTYNSILFQHESLSTGYSFSLKAHYLYLDAGLTYFRLKYQLGFYEGTSASNMLGDELSSEGLAAEYNLKWFFNYFFFVNWRYQRVLETDKIFYYSNQLGLNFYTRF